MKAARSGRARSPAARRRIGEDPVSEVADWEAFFTLTDEWLPELVAAVEHLAESAAQLPGGLRRLALISLLERPELVEAFSPPADVLERLPVPAPVSSPLEEGSHWSYRDDPRRLRVLGWVDELLTRWERAEPGEVGRIGPCLGFPGRDYRRFRRLLRRARGLWSS